jgi:hypothetical protein
VSEELQAAPRQSLPSWAPTGCHVRSAATNALHCLSTLYSSQHSARSAPIQPATTAHLSTHLWRHLLCRQGLLWQGLNAVKVKPLEQGVELPRGSLDHLQRCGGRAGQGSMGGSLNNTLNTMASHAGRRLAGRRLAGGQAGRDRDS